ncbi:MAG: hypothetical protein ABSA16_05880 [Thermoguttaceae bacterium]|jgi:hypothetical protein
MTTIEKIECDIKKLTRDELTAFRAWFAEYDSDEWDRQIEEDAKSGKLDKLTNGNKGKG